MASSSLFGAAMAFPVIVTVLGLVGGAPGRERQRSPNFDLAQQDTSLLDLSLDSG